MRSVSYVASPAALALLAVSGCGAAGPPIREIEKPVYSWSWTRGGCGGRRALDGAGTIWIEEGCEGSHPRRVQGPRVTLQQRAAIVAAFARLPEPSAQSCGAPSQEFQIDAGGRVRTWGICGVDVAELTAPFADVPRAFQGSLPP